MPTKQIDNSVAAEGLQLTGYVLPILMMIRVVFFVFWIIGQTFRIAECAIFIMG